MIPLDSSSWVMNPARPVRNRPGRTPPARRGHPCRVVGDDPRELGIVARVLLDQQVALRSMSMLSGLLRYGASVPSSSSSSVPPSCRSSMSSNRSRQSPPPSRVTAGSPGTVAGRSLGGDEVEVVRVAGIEDAVLDPVQGQPVCGRVSVLASAGAVPVDDSSAEVERRRLALAVRRAELGVAVDRLVVEVDDVVRRRWSGPPCRTRCRCAACVPT